MANVDDIVIRQRCGRGGRRHEERAGGRAEPVKHIPQVAFGDARLGEQFFETAAAANGPSFTVQLGQGAKRLLDRNLLSGACAQDLVGVAGERLGHASDVVVGLSGQPPRSAR